MERKDTILGTTQIKLKKDAEAFRKTKQEKYTKNTPGGGYQKWLVNFKDEFCSLMMGYPTEEWGEPTSPEIIL